MEMLPDSLTLATASAKGLALIFGNDLQTGILITLGTVLLLVGTLLRYKFPSKQEESSTTAYTFWAKPAQSTGYLTSAAGAAQSTSFTFRATVDRRNHRKHIGHLAMQSKSKPEQRAGLV
jgi:hypothetical protein